MSFYAIQTQEEVGLPFQAEIRVERLKASPPQNISCEMAKKKASVYILIDRFIKADFEFPKLDFLSETISQR